MILPCSLTRKSTSLLYKTNMECVANRSCQEFSNQYVLLQRRVIVPISNSYLSYYFSTFRIKLLSFFNFEGIISFASVPRSCAGSGRRRGGSRSRRRRRPASPPTRTSSGCPSPGRRMQRLQRRAVRGSGAPADFCLENVN